MRLLRLALPAVSLALASCITVVPPSSATRQAAAGSPGRVAVPSTAASTLPRVYLEAVPLTGGGTDVYVNIGGRTSPVKLNVAFYRSGTDGIAPKSALASGMFREHGDSEEDIQLLYVAHGQPGSSVDVFTTYAPEGNEIPRWNKLDTIRYD